MTLRRGRTADLVGREPGPAEFVQVRVEQPN